MKQNAIILATMLAVTLASAQSGGQFTITESTIDAGGGTSSGGGFSVSGTIGQPDAGTLSGGQFVLEGGFWSGLTVVQTPGAPLLKIKLIAGQQSLISWPASVSGFALEETESLIQPAKWSLTPQSIVDVGGEHTVTVPATDSFKFYRLNKL